MKLSVKLVANLAEDMRKETEAGERAVQRAITAAGKGLQGAWRAQVEGAGLGSRLARTIRSQAYPKGRNSMNAAALVWTNAPTIIDAHERGAVIRARKSLYLAIPLDSAGSGGRALRDSRTGRFAGLTPARWEQRTGMRLRFVYRRSAPSLLVADNARLNTRGQAALNRRKTRRDGIQTGSQTIPIFILVPQVRLTKRLDLAPVAERWASRLPQMITSNWPE